FQLAPTDAILGAGSLSFDRTGASISGSGKIALDVDSAGEINPEPAGAALQIGGAYSQRFDDGIIGLQSGRLAVQLTASAASSLDIAGTATLAGTLIVTSESQLDPPVGASFQVVSAAGGLGGTRFDAAILPGLSGDKFFRLSYVNGGGGRGVGSVSIVVDTLNGTDVEVDPQDPSPIPGLPAGAALGDLIGFDGLGIIGPDGRPDLAVVIPDDQDPTGAPGQIAILANAGDGGDGVWDGFSGGTLIVSTQPGGEQPVSLSLGDLDNDKDLDIVTANQAGGTVTPVVNDGLGGLAALAPVAAGVDRPRSVAVGDLDGDGRADVAVAGANSAGAIGQIAGLISAGPAGGFLAPAAQAFGGSHVWATLGDLDNDKDLDLDLVVADSGLNSVHRLENLGGAGAAWQGFALQQTILVNTGVLQASLGDLDNDKDLDFITVDRVGGTISIGLNNGLGTFGASSSLPVGSQPRSLALADLDADGDDDVAVIVDDLSQPGERLIRVLRNDLDAPGGQIALTAALDQPSSLRPRIALSEAATLMSGVTTRDLDGDGDDDVVTVNENPPSARGDSRGAGAMTSTTALLQGIAASPCVADLDGDGVVGVADLASVLGAWGQPGPADFDSSGDVGVSDLAQVLGSWGVCGG
ncbi:MAG: VCBS repeat-containing protein, partial [Planctomycetota bacterium]|nr:VCBS repeat-containing protein [Planctomycetota bacterium]